jgi:hypothetical protein
VTEPDNVTVLDRFLAAHISEERALEHLRSGRVKVDGELVSDPNHPAPKPAAVSLVAL